MALPSMSSRSSGRRFVIFMAAALCSVAAAEMETARLFGNLDRYAYYYVDLLVGSPRPQRTSVIIDTGSRLVGFPCQGCEHCGHHMDPAFNIEASKSASVSTCGLDCDGSCSHGHCTYSQAYAEGSSITGLWFHDQVALGGTVGKNEPVGAWMGCHVAEDMLFYTQRANGIMGLAPTNSDGSLLSKTILHDLFKDRPNVEADVFAICLATWGGFLAVGGYDAQLHLSGRSITWLRLSLTDYYTLFLDSLYFSHQPDDPRQNITVSGGGGSSFDADVGSAIVDSGTTFTFFPSTVYASIVARLREHCSRRDCGADVPPEGEVCWVLKDSCSPVSFPSLYLHFSDSNTDTEWLPTAYLHRGERDCQWCEAFRPNSGMEQTILGITWMMHHDVIFDLANKRLGIVPANCPEQHQWDENLTASEEMVLSWVGDQSPLRRAMGQGWLPWVLFSLALCLFFLASRVLFAASLWVCPEYVDEETTDGSASDELSVRSETFPTWPGWLCPPGEFGDSGVQSKEAGSASQSKWKWLLDRAV